MSDKKKYVRGTSPKGTAAWPRLTEPDCTFDPNGMYSVNLRLSMDDAKSLITQIDNAHKAQVAEVVKELKSKGKPPKVKEADMPYKPVLDEDGNETGEVEFKFKLKAMAGSKDKQWAQKPRLFDSKGKPLSTGVKVGSGSTIRVGYELFPYYVPSVGSGVSLRVLAVQVLELVEYGGGSFKDYGFNEEDGFEAAEQPAATSDSTEDDADEASAF